jgi:hypothetical protein
MIINQFAYQFIVVLLTLKEKIISVNKYNGKSPSILNNNLMNFISIIL